MSSDKMNKLSSYFQPEYDSDEDLDVDTRKKIQDSPNNADNIRNQAWDKADMYPKLKRMVKTGWYGDKQRKD